jgi:hypothetical protein
MLTASDSPRTNVPASRIFFWSIGILGTLGLVIFFAFDPTKVPIFPQCIFHQMTGLDCPGCGAQRALHQLLHGHLIAALQLNAMFVLSLPLFAWYAPRLVSGMVSGTPVPLNTRWLIIYFGAWLVFGILRDLPFPICAWFAA